MTTVTISQFNAFIIQALVLVCLNRITLCFNLMKMMFFFAEISYFMHHSCAEFYLNKPFRFIIRSSFIFILQLEKLQAFLSIEYDSVNICIIIYKYICKYFNIYLILIFVQSHLFAFF